MSINRVGKSNSPPAHADVGPATGAKRGETFSVSPSTPTTTVSGSETLARLSRGELRLEEYLEDRLSEATSHLEGALSPSQLDFVRTTLREQLSADPVLNELIRRTTGQSLGSGR